mmetsp:Transcript_22527/g.25176  ORF Transcript_22527/g.25176 Transcript_22527/m.25176 type:complete len:474 (+) Transcript_22527:11-1432(+)
MIFLLTTHYWLSCLFLFASVPFIDARASSTIAEEARWLVNVGNWGVFSYFTNKKTIGTATADNDDSKQQQLRSAAISYSDNNGRIFFYLMGKQNAKDVTLTLSEAALAPISNFAGAACGSDTDIKKDPEDPRCAKLSLQGNLSPCADELTCQIGKKALMDRHPEMKHWPVGHHFSVHELTIYDAWLISNYGGGSIIQIDDYLSAFPKHHPHYSTGMSMSTLSLQNNKNSVRNSQNDSFIILKNDNDNSFPDWDKKVERARWVVGHSLWTTVSTISVRLNGSAWGNIRSVVDGESYQKCTGKPVFYLPTPDPTSVDVQQNPTISLTFSEAALAERIVYPNNNSGDGVGLICGGLDPEDPLCAQVTITGKAMKINSDDESVLNTIYAAFSTRHPLAPWLAHGGAHTGGAYYTIEPNFVSILDYYGGSTTISVNDYLEWKAPPSLSTMPLLSSKKLSGEDEKISVAINNQLLRGLQ